MKRDMIEKVIKAIAEMGLINLTEFESLTPQGRLEEITMIAEEKVREIEEQENIDFIKAILRDFQEVVNGKVSNVVVDGISRESTYQDHIELIQNEWSNVSMKLFEELGIDLDEE